MTSNTSVSKAWIRVITLAFAAFVFNTTEFVPIALLTNIGDSFSMSVEEVGIMITIYAWVVALASLPLMLLVGNIERKRLLIIIFIIFIVSHFVCYFAQSFLILIIGRIGIAFSHAIFWSITAALAVRVAPLGKKSQALGILATGSALATVLGLPIGRVIGQFTEWRVTFLCIGIVATLILIILIYTLPKLPSKNSGSFSSIPLLFKRPALVGIFMLTVLIVTAHFTVYSYIEPYAENIVKMLPQYTTLLLLLFGGAGIVGSVIFSKYNTAHPVRFVPVIITLMVIILFTLHFVKHSTTGLYALSIVWGAVFMCVGLCLQVKVLELASDATDIAMAIYSGIFNIGIGGGALVGKIVIQKLSLGQVGNVGGAIAVIALGLTLFIFIKYRATFVEKAVSKEVVTH